MHIELSYLEYIGVEISFKKYHEKIFLLPIIYILGKSFILFIWYIRNQTYVTILTRILFPWLFLVCGWKPLNMLYRKNDHIWVSIKDLTQAILFLHMLKVSMTFIKKSIKYNLNIDFDLVLKHVLFYQCITTRILLFYWRHKHTNYYSLFYFKRLDRLHLTTIIVFSKTKQDKKLSCCFTWHLNWHARN